MLSAPVVVLKTRAATVRGRRDIPRDHSLAQANPTEVNKNGLKLAFGRCGHTFHLDCIQKWTKSNSSCPMCTTDWDSVKIEPIMGDMES